MNAALRPGTRVHAKGKSGVVRYVRFARPTYVEPEAYSVCLDERSNVPGYTGTMFASFDVHEVTTDTALMDSAAASDRRNES